MTTGVITHIEIWHLYYLAVYDFKTGTLGTKNIISNQTTVLLNFFYSETLKCTEGIFSIEYNLY